MKKTEGGERLCDTGKCEFIATHYLVWTKPQCYCLSCAEKMLGIGEFMGHPTPAATFRPMTLDEMMPEEAE